MSVRASDKRIACDEEFSDSEDEGEGGRRNVADHKKGAKKARIEEDKKDTEDKKTGQIYFLVNVLTKFLKVSCTAIFMRSSSLLWKYWRGGCAR